MKTGEPLALNHLLDGRYRISKVLGQGGMGRVYLANDTRLANRPVACKEMTIGDGIQEQKAVEDFNREARVLASLSHPAIPQVIDYFGERGRHYLVMEFVAGGDLQGHLDKLGPGGRFPEAKVLRWARQILDVLQFLHAQDPPIIYRDLKPGNIMIDQRGRAMLVDFGIARFLPPGGRGTQIGSVGYAPPEQYLGKMEARSDLYSLAATMHHLLTGRDPQLEPPFSFPPLKSLAPETSNQTGQVVMRALEKDMEKRPRSAREMHDLLPDPGTEEAGVAPRAGALPAGSNASGSGAPAMSAMATIVLDRPAFPSPAGSPIVDEKSAPKPASGSQLKTRRSLKLPLAVAPARPVKSPVRSGNSAAKQAMKGQVSPTAKTQDLGLKPARRSESKASSSSASTPTARNQNNASTSSRRTPADTVPDQSPVRGIHPALKNPPVKDASHNGHGSGQVMIGPRLVAINEGTQFSLNSARLLIGRSIDRADAIDIDLAKLVRGSDRVSRRHAEIVRNGVDYFIRDLGSLNGTYIAGRGRLGRDQLYRLSDRDEIIVGGTKLEFRKA